MLKEKIEKLYANLDVKTREGLGGLSFKYVASSDVIDRFNRVMEGSWSTKIVEQKIIEDTVVVFVEVSYYDSDNNMWFNQVGVGSSFIKRFSRGNNTGKPIDIGNDFKSAKSKAIKNAVSCWGLGLYLDVDAEDDVSTETYESASVKKEPKKMTGFDMPSFGTGASKKKADLPDDIGGFTKKDSKDSSGSTKTKSTLDFPDFSSPSKISDGGGEDGYSSVVDDDVPFDVDNQNTGNKEISYVQKTALEILLKTKKKTLEELSKKLLGNEVKSLDDLSFDDATKILRNSDN